MRAVLGAPGRGVPVELALPFYTQDSFFTLSLAGRAGLLVLTGLLALAMILLVWRMRSYLPAFARPLMAIGLFWLFLWLSPQIYYTYYQMIIPGLPVQSVIKMPPSPAEMIQLMTFQGRATLAQHGQGLMAIQMIITSLWPHSNDQEAKNRASG